ncbi:MAG: hypothetical protein WBD31_03620, partial [Rubripirellula sp.]
VLTLEKDLTVAKAAVQNLKERGTHISVMADSGYLSDLEIEENEFAVTQAERNLQLKQTQLEVLKNFTYREQLQSLKGQLAATEATHKANIERAMADNSRRDRAVEELKYCVIKAPRSGLVIHPNAAKWETAPIAEGTLVHKDQVLLLMPDLNQMQVKVGVHESTVKRVRNDQRAVVTLPTRTLEGVVTDVASITKPAGWWTGNQVRYDTIITLPAVEDLRPGTSADVQIRVAHHQNVLRIPVATIVQHENGAYCWVQTSAGARRRQIVIGDSNDVFTEVQQGLQAGDEVILNPMAYEAPVIDESTDEKAAVEKSTADESSAGDAEASESDEGQLSP